MGDNELSKDEVPIPVPIASLISKEFLESHLKAKVLSFSIQDGTKPGDNFMSVLYSISVKVKVDEDEGSTDEDDSGKQHHHLLLKCYPSHPSRQKFLNKSNLFYHELMFYKEIARDLVHFQVELAGLLPQDVIPLGIPPYHGGTALNFSEMTWDGEQLFSPLDNYILMADLRKSSPSSPFQMPDSKVGLDGMHMKLAFTELATLHALSWAYMKKGKLNLKERYPFLTKKVDPENRKMWLGFLVKNTGTAVQAIDSVLGTGNELSKAIRKYSEGEGATMLQYFNDQDPKTEVGLRGKLRNLEKSGIKENENLPIWRVLCHGDCWTNNFLFQYDPVTGTPARAALVDFSLIKVGCPTFDLSCLVYTSTRKEFRQTGLKSCMEAYHDQFIHVCKALKLGEDELPARFSVDILLQKFHVSKLIGLLIALLSLPGNLIEKGDDTGFNLDGMDKKSTIGEMLQQATSSGGKGELYKEWMLELAQELYDEGVI